ncbi:MAG TPA: hypothetical protein VFB14_12255 [Bryobacteraceae bacterium]|jgi:hypothetical protein|nr:hypothetical protein [Bryobacteraceae bacterium]
MIRAFLIVSGICLLSICCVGQQPVAPTPEAVGSPRGENWSDYNFVNSFETGYRFLSVSGNEGKYRSDENFGSGVRLLSSFFSMDSKDGHGRFLDQMIVSTSGLGGDPYSSVSVRVEKNRLYNYNLLWRENDYVNPGLVTDGGAGLHLLNTSYTLQDHDLTLFPQSAVRVLFGYTRDAQSGPGISSVQLFNTSGPFDSTGDVFPLFTNVKRTQNEYRLGAEIHWLGFTLNALHGWQDFKDDSPLQFSGFNPGDNGQNASTLNSFSRSIPYHGTSPYWRVGLFRDSRWIDVNARFTYTAGVRAFLSNESAVGTNRFGALANQQIFTFGSARRPVTTGNLNVALLPASKLTFTSRTSLYNIRTDGDSTFLQFDNATKSADLLYFQFLRIRTVETDLDVQYRPWTWLDLYGTYGYSNRRIAASPQVAFAGSTPGAPYLQTNQLHSGAFGFRVRPLKSLTIATEGEVGRSDRPFTPRSPRDYTTLSGRIQYKWKSLQLTALSNSQYNTDSISLSSYSSHARTYSGSGSWSPRSWFSIDATYSKLHLDTLGGIAFFAGPQFLTNQLSSYVSNVHSATLATRLGFKRLDLYLGYSRVQDVGDGRSSAISTIVGPRLPAFQTAQTFPLTFQSPSARLSVRLTEKLRWNAGYQYYGYDEVFWHGENYLAHTGYTSILWSF